jgi:CRP-like cAMP-binding protein
MIFRKENITDDMNIDDCETITPEAFLDFDPLFQYEPKHSKTLAAKEVIAVFTLPLEVFYESLLHNYHSKLNQKLKLFRKIPIFESFENSKLRTLIEKLSIVEMKKNEYVYREGEEPRCFYMLIDGEVEISKTIGIFNENPNNFYKNRIQVSREKMNHQLKILPYANFNGVYNYQPEQKVITLAQINPICIFGEEEIIDLKERQVNAKVLSLSAQLYEIHLEDIEELCNKMIGANGERKMTLVDFLLMMEESVTLKKILFRQSQLSDLVHYENKNKYSTLFEAKSTKKSKSFRKSIPHSKATFDEGDSRRISRRSM